jgi:hypothetical protein
LLLDFALEATASFCSPGEVTSAEVLVPPKARKNLSGPVSTEAAGNDGLGASAGESAAGLVPDVDALLAFFICSIHFWKSCCVCAS